MAGLYGRDAVCERLREALKRAGAGQGVCLVLTGEPGIGKSSLAEYVAELAAADRFRVAWGRAWEEGGAPSYWPWLQILRAIGLDQETLPGQRDFGGHAQARFAALDRVIRRLKRDAQAAPLALLLEDLHAADVPSLLLLLLLAQQLEGSPIFVLATYRDAEVQANEVGQLLAKLTRYAELHALTRLAPEDVNAWFAHTMDTASEQAAAELYRITEGHPLFIAELLRLSAERRAAAPIESLNAVIAAQFERIAPETRALLRMAAVLGREISAPQLAAFARIQLDQVVRCLQEAVLGSVVVSLRTGERYRFSHSLLRDWLYFELLPSERAERHWQAGTHALETQGELSVAANHLLLGSARGNTELAAEVSLQAGAAALARLAFENAAQFAARAAALLTNATTSLLAGRLCLLEAEALLRSGDSVAARAKCARMLAMAREVGSSELFARAALVHAADFAIGQIDPAMVALLREALSGLPQTDSALRARVTARLAAALMPPAREADIHEILGLMSAAMAMAMALGEVETRLYVLQFAASTALPLLGEEERAAMLEEAFELARETEQPLALCAVAPAFAASLLGRGRRAEGEDVRRLYASVVQELGSAGEPWRPLLLSALFHLHDGEFALAQLENAHARELSDAASSRSGRRLCATQRIDLALLSGQLEPIREQAANLLASSESLSGAPFGAWILAALGQREQAAQRLREARINLAFLPGVCIAAEACALIGDPALSDTYYEALLRFRGRVFYGAAWIIGPTSRILGDLSFALGRVEQALLHYEEALGLSERIGAPGLALRCQHGIAACAEKKLAPTISGPRSASITLRREGEVWLCQSTVAPALRLKHSKGIDYLNHLLDRPNEEVHVLELLGLHAVPGDAGPLLDQRAKLAYRTKIRELQTELADAEHLADLGRAQRAREQLEQLSEAVARAVGLGGRDRRAASGVERARINVQRRLKNAMDRIDTASPELGRYLQATVRTGTYCVYRPL